MDPRYSAQADAFREQVKTFLAEHLPPGWQGIGAMPHDEARAFTARWRATLHQHGLLGVTWPREYGGAGLTKLEQVVLVEELAKAGAPSMGPNDTFSMKMVGGLLLQWGSDEQKRKFLPRILSGDDTWCQGYSEPDNGSDLAGLRTSATLDGDDWVIHGQKIWQTRARESNWIFTLVRTDPRASKHRGLTMLLVPMDQPAIEVHPIRMMGGSPDFNAVFFDGARTSKANAVGEVNGGWAVANSVLALERGDEAATNPVLFRAELDRLITMAGQLGRLSDPVIRDRLADAHARVEIMRFVGYRGCSGCHATCWAIRPPSSWPLPSRIAIASDAYARSVHRRAPGVP